MTTRRVHRAALSVLLATTVGLAALGAPSADASGGGSTSLPSSVGDDVLPPDRIVPGNLDASTGRQLQSFATTSLPGRDRVAVTFDPDADTSGVGLEPVPDRYRAEVRDAAADLGRALGDGPQLRVVVTVDPSLPWGVLGTGGPTTWRATDDGCLTSSQFVDQGGAPVGMAEMRVRLSADTERWDDWAADPDAGRTLSLLYRTLVHEYVHGLGFGSASHGTLDELYFATCNGAHLPYDRLLHDRHGTELPLLGPLVAMLAATSHVDLHAGHEWAAYTPSTWRSGSSLSHIDPDVVEGGLMAPSIKMDRSDLGAATLDVLAALGWTPEGAPPAPTGVVATRTTADPTSAVAVTWDTMAAADHGYLVSWTDAAGQQATAWTPTPGLTIPEPAASTTVRVATDALTGRTWSGAVRPGDPAPEESDPDPTPTSDPEDDAPTRPDGVSRLAGPSRYATAAAVSAAAFEQAEVVLLATGQSFPDALAGAAVADRYGAPVLLTDPARLPTETAAALARLAPSRLLVLGGESAVADHVATAAAQAAGGAVVERLSGPDRYATAAEVASRVPASDTVMLATGTGFPDALAGAGVAAGLGAPMLLTDPDVLPAATRRVLAERRPTRIVVLGGTTAVSDPVAAAAATTAGGATIQRVAGPDRYATAAAVADLAGTTPAVLLATGQSFPDALAGAAVAARLGAPVLLTDATVLPDATREALVRRQVRSVTVLGGEGAVGTWVLRDLQGWLP